MTVYSVRSAKTNETITRALVLDNGFLCLGSYGTLPVDIGDYDTAVRLASLAVGQAVVLLPEIRTGRCSR